MHELTQIPLKNNNSKEESSLEKKLPVHESENNQIDFSGQNNKKADRNPFEHMTPKYDPQFQTAAPQSSQGTLQMTPKIVAESVQEKEESVEDEDSEIQLAESPSKIIVMGGAGDDCHDDNKSSTFQPKLMIGQPGDKFEREAEAVAGRVMRMNKSEPIQMQPDKEEELLQPKLRMQPNEEEGEAIQMKCAECEKQEDEKMQRNEINNATPQISNSVHQTLQSSGRPLDKPTRSFMEQHFGFDFGKVQIHDNQLAHQSAKDINALAYTHGHHIAFDAGQYQPQTESGRKLIAHELTHTLQQGREYEKKVQRQPAAPIQSKLNALCYQSGVVQPNPSAREPDLHVTYERWLASFTGMVTFSSNDTAPGSLGSSFNVLGTEGADYNDPAATTETESVPRSGGAAPADNFIDHPTNQWVQNCLPDNLRATAYQLPADCADIAVILRHVWLSAHHRTETYNGWVVGDLAGHANQAMVRRLIVGEDSVFSGNVHLMLQPYTDASGTPLLDFRQLAPMLHPGDILVWKHIRASGSGSSIRIRRTGGHTQTINHIDRSGATVTGINVLQGNQPVFSADATAILQFQGARDTSPDSSRGHALRDSPGRRIEASQAISISNIPHPNGRGTQIWGEDDGPASGGGHNFTILVAAGPPRSAARPASTGRTRSILDWTRSVNRANANTLIGVLESMLLEARSNVEGGMGNTPATAEMETMGRLTGERLRNLNAHAVDRLIQFRNDMTAITQALRDDSTNVAGVTGLFNSFTQAFNLAAVPQGTGVEGTRLFTENTSVAQFLAPFVNEITDLSTGLSKARNLVALQSVVNNSGVSLWQAATARAQALSGGDLDDRPLYWTRVRMIEEIRNFAGRISVSASRRQQLIDSFESASRGRSTIDFSTAISTQKKILISGFDPFGFNVPLTSSSGSNQTILDANPSGSAVLALDGEQVSGSGGTSGFIQGVIFPVRYTDFDQGMIENLFTPFLNGTQPVSMIMTISQGGGSFDIERWAGRNRSATLPDNAGVPSGGSSAVPVVPPGIAGGPEFLETQLPHSAMSSVPDTHLNQHGRSPGLGVQGPSVTGTGGGFLSNEIFYRVRLLQTNIGGSMVNLPVGHLHVPTEDDMPVSTIVDRIKAIISAALPSI